MRGSGNWGSRVIPHRIKRYPQYFNSGRYVYQRLQVEQFDAKFWLMNITALFHGCWLMHFDANPTTIQVLGKKLRVDPHLLRHTVIKPRSKLHDVIACPEKTI